MLQFGDVFANYIFSRCRPPLIQSHFWANLVVLVLWSGSSRSACTSLHGLINSFYAFRRHHRLAEFTAFSMRGKQCDQWHHLCLILAQFPPRGKYLCQKAIWFCRNQNKFISFILFKNQSARADHACNQPWNRNCGSPEKKTTFWHLFF